MCAPEGLEYTGISGYARAFNPAIKVTRLKGAPLEGPEDRPTASGMLGSKSSNRHRLDNQILNQAAPVAAKEGNVGKT